MLKHRFYCTSRRLKPPPSLTGALPQTPRAFGAACRSRLATIHRICVEVTPDVFPLHRRDYLCYLHLHPFCLSLFLSHPELQLIRKSGMVRDAFSTNPKFAERDCYLNSADNQIVINVLRALRAVFPAQGAVR